MKHLPATLMFTTGLIAAFVPVHHAGLMDPALALREE